MFAPVKTPCIGVCSTGIGDNVCRGCKRFAHEVIDWNAYTEEQRRAIDARLQSLLRQVVEPKLLVVNEALLHQQIELQQIRYNAAHNCYSWAFDLLKAGASQIEDIRQFGCRLQPEWQGRSLKELKAAIDADFYALSCAYFDRYVAPGINAANQD
jgi:predicted Fe-S protein YdhL (DUF1289 family)